MTFPSNANITKVDSLRILEKQEDKFPISLKWLAIGISSLMLAGVFALVLVIGRAPYINQIIYSPAWAKKCLVIHVNLALGVWFFSFLVALFFMIPGNKPKKYTIPMAYLGIFIFAILGFFLEATPILANYIPVLDDPLFVVGLAIFMGAVALSFIDKRMFFWKKNVFQEENSFLPEITFIGLRVAVFAFWIALSILIASIIMTSTTEFNRRVYYDILFWGSGHVFQFANVSAMISGWIILFTNITKRPPFGKKIGLTIFTCLLIPVLVAPFLLYNGTNSLLYRHGFTNLMRWGIWPGVVLLLLAFGFSIFSPLKDAKTIPALQKNASFSGLILSILLTLTGFTLGAYISTSTTLIPAHYHASIGAVTVCYMSLSYLILESFGFPFPNDFLKKLAFYQPIFFGVGQILFALGFGYAGLYGLGRKVYGSEQQISLLQQKIGLGIMGVGGALAIVGGISYLWIVGKSVFPIKKTT